MGIVSWIILGLIAGFIGSKVVDKRGQGFWLNIALEHLQHDCRDCGLDRGAADLQCCRRLRPGLRKRRGGT